MKKRISWFLCILALAASTGAAEHSSTNRPKIGLVLGGGGALGMSHIGVLRVLEEQRVPIDYIAGTSMGAIIAGLYASGMSPDEIQAFLEGLDWDEVMTDNTPRRELFFRRKLEDQRYLLEVGVGREGLKMGTGLAAGQKFNNALQFQVQRSAAITDFDKLSIPYRAVATDLVSGQPYVIDHGNLARAMRASMAVPGVFTAVELEGHLLVDGGIVNNLPVDVVESMGADIIIAVDVGAASDKADPKKLRSIGGILGRTYAIAQRPGQLESLERADIGLQPDLADFTAAEFDRVSELIPQGEAAAREKIEEFRPFAVDAAAYREHLAKQRRAQPESIIIESVEVTGNERVSEKAIQGRIYSKPGDSFNSQAIQHDLMRVYGIGEFEQVLYNLDQTEEGRGNLTYITTEKPAGPLYLAFGLNLRSDFQNDSDWNILVNLTRRSINALGAEWRNEIQLGSTQGVLSEFYQPLNAGGTFFVAPIVEYRSEIEDLYDGKSHVAEYDVQTVEGRFDFGIQLRHYAQLRVGPAWGSGKAEVDTGDSDLPEFDERYFGSAVSLIIDRQDRTYFPREGYYLSVGGIFARKEMGGESSHDRVFVDAQYYKSFSDHTFALGLVYGDNLGSDLPGFTQFKLGGIDNFSGLAEGQFRGSTIGVASTGYKYRLMTLPSQIGKGIYVVSRFDVGNVWENDIDTDDLRYGLEAGLGIDTDKGPVTLTYGIADGGYSTFYFSLGSNF